GAESAYGPHATAAKPREVVLKLAARHLQARALEIFAGEVFPVATGTVQGLAGAHGGRPKVQPVVRLFSFLLDKSRVPVRMVAGGAEPIDCPWTISADEAGKRQDDAP